MYPRWIKARFVEATIIKARLNAMKKRYFLQISGATVGAIALSRFLPSIAKEPTKPKTSTASKAKFEINKTEAEWRKSLTPAAFAVLRQHATERPHSSPLNQIKQAGIYSCAGCGLPLYSSQTKFDSGTGWPSFYAALNNAIGTTEDRSRFMLRTEVHCRRCGGHLGHVFDDGPPPTGKRHCLNGVALKFKAA
jgi:peptide-methionine (R)-S-oxide reductase